MGFSLSNLLKQGVAQVNPFDHGQTAATVRQQPAAPVMAQLPSPGQPSLAGRIGNAISRIGAAPHPVQTVTPDMQQAITTAKYGKLANNPQLQQQAIHGLQSYQQKPSITDGLSNAGDALDQATMKTIVQPMITRPAAEAVSTARDVLNHGKYGASYTPGSAFEKGLFGDTPVQSIQQKSLDQYGRQSTSSNPLLRLASRPLAAGEAALSVANDIPVVGAGIKYGTKGVALGTSEAAKAAETLVPKAAPVLNKVAQGTKGLSDLVDQGAMATAKAAKNVHLSGKDKLGANAAIDREIAQRTAEVKSLQQAQAKTPIGSAASENHQTKIDMHTNRIADLLAGKQKLNLAEKLMNQHLGNTVGGENALGYMHAKKTGRVFDGVDGKPRFEIDDSKSWFKGMDEEAAQYKEQLASAQYKLSVDPNDVGAQRQLQQAQANLQTMNSPNLTPQLRARLQSGAKLGDILDHPTLYKNYPDLKNVSVKFDDFSHTPTTRGQVRGGNIALNEASLTDPNQLHSTLLHEVQHTIQARENTAKGGMPNVEELAFKNQILKEQLAKTNQELATVTPGSNGHAPLLQKRNDLIKALNETQDQYGSVEGKAHQNYERLAGEAEARAVAARKNLPDSARYQKVEPSYKSLDQEAIHKQPNLTNKQLDNLSLEAIDGLKQQGFKGVSNGKRTVRFDEQGQKLYRGGKDFNNYLSTHEHIAADYAKHRGGTVSEHTLNPNAKVVNYEDIPDVQFKGLDDYNVADKAPNRDVLSFMENQVEADYSKAAKWAKDNGFDAVRFPTEGEVRILNKSALSKSQPATSLRSTFYDSLDVPKDELIIRKGGEGPAMSIDKPKTPTLTAYGRTIEMTEKNGYRPIDTPSGTIYQKVARTGTNAKGTQLTNTWYSADGTKLSKAQADAMVSGKLAAKTPAAPAKKQLPVSPDAAKPAPAPQATGTGKVSLPQDTPKMTIPADAPSSGQATRSYGSNTIAKDTATGQDIKDAVANLTYNIRNTKDLQTRAANLIKDNPELALRVAQSDNTDVGVMLGNQLIPHLSRNGQTDLAIQLAKETAAKLTKSGQTSQAAAAYGKLAPEGVLRFTQQVIDDYNRTAELKPGKELALTPEKAQSILKKSEDLQNMPDGRDKDIATAQMLKEIKEIPPASWVAKLSTLQTIGQLLNPKTMIRNVGGNGLFGGLLENASQAVSAGVDKGIGLATKERKVALPQLGAQVKGFKQGATEQWQESTKGVNLGPETQFDLKDVPTFRKGVMGNIEKTLGITLRVPDRAAYQAAFNDTVQGLMKANKLKQPTQGILEQAHANGLYRTFQNDSQAAKLFSGLKQSLNHLGVEGKDGKRWGLGDIILKYPKTPGNILSAGIDYSPAGVAKGIIKAGINAMQGKPFDQAALSNSIGRGVVGSGGLIGTGAALGALGIITEKPSQDADTRNVQKESGQGGYQINTSALRRFILSGFNKNAAGLQPNDTLVSYDWAQPASIPLSAGAAMGKKQGIKAGAVSSITGAADGLNTLVEQPLVTGVSTLAGNIKNKGLVGAIGESFKGAPASFVPTALNQVRQLTDNTTRNTYDPKAPQQVLNMVANRIPGLDRRLQPQVGPLGEDKQNYQNGSNNIFNVAFNPAFVSKYQPKDSAKLPLNIMNQSGDTKQMPLTPKTTQQVNGSSLKLTPQQNTDFARYVGSQTDAAYKALGNDPNFKALSPADQAKKMSGILSDINAAAKVQVLGNQDTKLSKGSKSVLNGQTPNWTDTSIAKGIDSHSAKVLQEYNALSKDRIKQKAYSEPDYDYKVAVAKYQNDMANGSLSKSQIANRRTDITKAAVGSKYSKDVRELYGLSKSELYGLLTTDPKGQAYADQLNAYDNDLKNKGLISSLKFKNGFAPSTSGSGGSSASSIASAYGSNHTKALGFEKSLRSIAQNASMKKVVSGGSKGSRKVATYKAPKSTGNLTLKGSKTSKAVPKKLFA